MFVRLCYAFFCCLIVKLVLRAVFVLFDCYVSAMRCICVVLLLHLRYALYLCCLIVTLVLCTVFVLFDCYVSASHCLCVL